MHNPDVLESLAQRCEQATGGDSRLNAEIDCAIRFPHLRPAEPDDHKEYQRGVPPGAGHIWCESGFLLADPYTRSIDAAMTLVPEGLVIKSTLCADGELQITEAWFHTPNNEAVDGLYVVDGYTKPTTPPLAILIVALRARKALEASTQPSSQRSPTDNKGEI